MIFLIMGRILVYTFKSYTAKNKRYSPNLLFVKLIVEAANGYFTLKMLTSSLKKFKHSLYFITSMKIKLFHILLFHWGKINIFWIIWAQNMKCLSANVTDVSVCPGRNQGSTDWQFCISKVFFSSLSLTLDLRHDTRGTFYFLLRKLNVAIKRYAHWLY